MSKKELKKEEPKFYDREDIVNVLTNFIYEGDHDTLLMIWNTHFDGELKFEDGFYYMTDQEAKRTGLITANIQ